MYKYISGKYWSYKIIFLIPEQNFRKHNQTRGIFVITVCMLGNFLCFCCRLLTFSKLSFSHKKNPKHYQSVKLFGSSSGPTFCRSWSESKLFAKVIRRRQKSLPRKELIHTHVRLLISMMQIASKANIFSIKLWLFSYPSVKTCVLGAQKNRLMGSFEYQQHMFCWLRNKKIIFSYILLSGGLMMSSISHLTLTFFFQKHIKS